MLGCGTPTPRCGGGAGRNEHGCGLMVSSWILTSRQPHRVTSGWWCDGMGAGGGGRRREGEQMMEHPCTGPWGCWDEAGAQSLVIIVVRSEGLIVRTLLGPVAKGCVRGKDKTCRVRAMIGAERRVKHHHRQQSPQPNHQNKHTAQNRAHLFRQTSVTNATVVSHFLRTIWWLALNHLTVEDAQLFSLMGTITKFSVSLHFGISDLSQTDVWMLQFYIAWC